MKYLDVFFVLSLVGLQVVWCKSKDLSPTDKGKTNRHSDESEVICGTRPHLRRSRSKRIVGGTDAKRGSWPWQVALYCNGTQYCGGSVIHPKWVLTAAHCFRTNLTSCDPRGWTVIAGEHNIEKKEIYEQRTSAKKIIMHPKFAYQANNAGPPEYDVALVKLRKPVTYDDFVQPICLLTGQEEFPPFSECYITGWGHTTYNGTQAMILQEAKVQLIPRDKCNSAESYNGTVHELATCAGYDEGNIDSCNYDSGGPLSCNYRGRWYLRGATSWGFACALPKKFGVYSNMEVLTNWVKRKAGLDKGCKKKDQNKKRKNLQTNRSGVP